MKTKSPTAKDEKKDVGKKVWTKEDDMAKRIQIFYRHYRYKRGTHLHTYTHAYTHTHTHTRIHTHTHTHTRIHTHKHIHKPVHLLEGDDYIAHTPHACRSKKLKLELRKKEEEYNNLMEKLQREVHQQTCGLSIQTLSIHHTRLTGVP